MRVAIDTGGTFTDCVYLRDGKLQVLKVFSTPADPGLAVLEALRKICAPWYDGGHQRNAGKKRGEGCIRHHGGI